MVKSLFIIAALSGTAILSQVGCQRKPAEPVDTIPPARITNLKTTDSTSTSVTVRWTAPGDDGMEGNAHSYDLRYHTDFLTIESWVYASKFDGLGQPLRPHYWEYYVIDDLESAFGYYLAVRTSDDDGNWSDISNVVTFHVPDTFPPSPVTDLSVTSIDSHSVTLSWTAQGDDSSSGFAESYELRYNTEQISDSNWNLSMTIPNQSKPLPSGNTEEFKVDSLNPDTDYYFGLKIVDDADNNSLLSNIVQARTLYVDTTTIDWEITIGGPGDEIPLAITQDSEGNVVVAGQSKESELENNGFLARISVSGILLWEKTYGGGNLDYFNDVVPTLGYAYLAVGVSRSFGVGVDEPYLVKVDNIGNIIWEKTISDSLGSLAVSVDGDGTSGFIIGGSSRRLIGNCVSSHAMLLKINENGEAEWDKHFVKAQACSQFPCSFATNGYKALDLSKGGYALTLYGYYHGTCGHTGADGPPSYFSRLKITTPVGETIRDIDGPSDYYNQHPGDMALELYSGYIFVSFNGSIPVIRRVDSLGIEQWNLSVPSVNGESFSGVIQLQSGAFLLASQNGTLIRLLNINVATGAEVGEISVKRDNTGVGELVMQASDGDVVVAGWVRSQNGDRDVRVIKIRNSH